MIMDWNIILNYALAEYQKSIINNMEFTKKSNEYLYYFVI